MLLAAQSAEAMFQSEKFKRWRKMWLAPLCKVQGQLVVVADFPGCLATICVPADLYDVVAPDVSWLGWPG